jgi:hypothetical protein
MSSDNTKLSIGSAYLGMKLDQVYQDLGEPDLRGETEEGIQVLLYRPTSCELDEVTVKATGGIVREVYGHRLTCDGQDVSPSEEDFSEMHSRVSELLSERLGAPDKIFETEELGAECWLYSSRKLQIFLYPGKPPSYLLREDCQVPDFSIPESEIDEFDYNLNAGIEMDWQPNPRAKIIPYDD